MHIQQITNAIANNKYKDKIYQQFYHLSLYTCKTDFRIIYYRAEMSLMSDMLTQRTDGHKLDLMHHLLTLYSR